MFVNEAMAAAGAGESQILGLLPLLFVVLVFYILLIRPYQKKAKQHQKVLAALKVGDRVVVGGGLLGVVQKIIDDKDEIVVEVAKNIRISALKSSVASVLGNDVVVTENLPAD